MVRNNNRGASLIAAVFLILVLSFLGWVMLSMSTLASRESINELYSARAYYDACSAAEVAIVLIDQTEVNNWPSSTPLHPLHPSPPLKPGDMVWVEIVYQFEQGEATVKAETKVKSLIPLTVTDYWKLTATATNGTEASADYAKRRLIVKFLKKL